MWKTERKIDVTCACGNKFQAYDLGGFTRKTCEECVRKSQLEEEARIQAEALIVAEREQRERVRRARIPLDFQNVRFENSNPRLHPKALHQCKNYAKEFNASSPSLIIYSEVFGAGKTHLAACIANYLLHERHMDIRFVKARDILLEIRSTYVRGARQDENDVLNRMLSATVLVIDDLGVDSPTEWTAETFWTLFDRRQESRLPVIVTTNCEPVDESLGARIGRGALSRLCGLCGDNIITFKGKDLRRNKTLKEE